MSEDPSKRIDDVHKRFDDGSRFRWTVTTMVALFGVAVPVWMWFLGLILKLR